MFKPVLKDASEILAFICKYSGSPVDELLLEDYFFNCKAILTTKLLSELSEGNSHQNVRDLKKEVEYLKLPQQTMPPIMIENGTVIDGNHRFRIAKRRKLSKILTYDILENNDESA